MTRIICALALTPLLLLAQEVRVSDASIARSIGIADPDTAPRLDRANTWNAQQTFNANLLQQQGFRSVFGGTDMSLLPVTRFQINARNSVGQWYEAFAVDDNGVADRHVVVVIPEFLSMGRAGKPGFIEFGPTAGAEAIITGTGSPSYHLIYRVSKQPNSGHRFGYNTSGGFFEIARSSDNFVSNAETLVMSRSNGVTEFRKHAGAIPTLRFIGTDGTTHEGEIWHDGNLRLRSGVGSMILENTSAIYFGPNASTNPVFTIDNSVANAAAGLKVTGRAAASGADLVVTSSAANENLRLNAKGAGSITLGSTSTGRIILGQATTVSNGDLTVSAGGIGYASGAGGTVTQVSSKSNGVTVNRPSIQITMNNAALAPGAKVSFTVTDSFVAASDVPVCAVARGSTAHAYRAAVTAVTSGGFDVTLENIAERSLSEAPVINCNVIKGASS